MNDIGKYLKELRDRKDYSISQLELYSGVSAAHISRMERGLRKPSPKMLERLYKSLDTTYEDLMFRAGYIDTDQKTSFTGKEFIELVPDDYKLLFEDQNIGYMKFANEMIKENIDIDTLKELIALSKKIRGEYENTNENPNENNKDKLNKDK